MSVPVHASSVRPKPVNRYLPNRANPKRSPNPYASWGSNMPYSHPWTGTTYPTEEPGHWAETIRAIRRVNPDTTIEVLIPDFDCRKELLDIVIDAAPDIIGHNIETVERLTPLVRSRPGTALRWKYSATSPRAARWPKAASCSASERPKPRYWQRSTTWPMRDAPSSRWASTCVPP